jgi:ketosteroid isomerase-like protein
MTAEETSLAFVEAINAKDIDGISELMTLDHVYIEPDGERVEGRERMRTGWLSYFALVPDYRIVVEETFSRGDTVVLLGRAEGTLSTEGLLRKSNRWMVPAAWRAVVREGCVASWQLYVDTTPIRKVMERSGLA